MNKTLITLGFFVIIALGIIGSAVLLVVNPDAAAQFATILTSLLGIGTAAVVTIYGLGKQQASLDTIKKQTNGNLSSRDAEIRRLTDLLIAAGIAPAGTPPALPIGTGGEPLETGPGRHL